MPGQNSNGTKGARVVSVPANTGTNTSPAAIIALLVRIRFAFTFGKYPVRIFDYHDSIIHNNTQAKQQAQTVQ